MNNNSNVGGESFKPLGEEFHISNDKNKQKTPHSKEEKINLFSKEISSRSSSISSGKTKKRTNVIIEKDSKLFESSKEINKKSSVISSGKIEIKEEKTEEIGVDVSVAEFVMDDFIQSQIEECKNDIPRAFDQCKTGRDEFQVTKKWLMDGNRLSEGRKPRMELRQVPGNDSCIANIALCYANGSERDIGYKKLKESFPDISLVSAGQTTVEIGTKNVSKATTINYIANHFDELLEQMNYIPGKHIDASQTKSVVISDADGTIWDPPQRNESPEARNLDNSPAKESILNYLRSGGIVIINSGNDPTRTFNRIMKGVPEEEKQEICSRIAIGAAGGHTLVVINKEGLPEEVSGYRKHALEEQKKLPVHPSLKLDVIYLGDDPRETGNDFPAFEKLGKDHYICVADHKKTIPESLASSTVVGETKAVENIFSAIVKRAAVLPKKPLFDEVPTLITIGLNSIDAKKMVETTLQATGGREGLNQAVAYNDSHNGPVSYVSKDIDKALVCFDENIRSKYTTKDDPSKTKINLDYDTLLKINNEYVEALKSENLNAESLCNNFNVEDPSFENFMKESLDRMNLKDGSIIRILEPGNNEQTTPMYVAYQIKYIQQYAKEKDINLNVQVLVMGMGGHATTGLFPLIGEFHNGKFSGTTEAESLGSTLIESLRDEQIDCEVVEQFKQDSAGKVQIKLAKESKNTGENVQEAINCIVPGGNNPEHLYISSSKASSARQALTFAQQYSEDKSKPLAEKKYETMTAIPIFRTEAFIKTGMTNEQAVTELYMGLAEECRIILYGFNPDQQFIPPSPLEKERLDHIYDMYDKLSGTNDIEKSKQVSLNNVLGFFNKGCQTAEKALMTWNKKLEDQIEGTRNATISILKRQKQKADFIHSIDVFNEAKKQPQMSDELKNKVDRYEKLYNQFRVSTDDREKFVIGLLMINAGNKIENELKLQTQI
ncbi:MAG: hypothetical protein Q8K60_04505 [Parachlamydiaceae bacterium]|nr:hypothetical protein [Parachlamydiaceae bacterium]